MILSNVEIHRALDDGRLIIEPEPVPRIGVPDNSSPYGTHSVDLRLGAHLRIPRPGPYNFDLGLPNFPEFLERNSEKIVIESARPYILGPNQFILGITLERVALPIDVSPNA